MAGNHVEDHLSLAASSSLGRRKISLTKTPRLVPKPKKRRRAFPLPVYTATRFFVFFVRNAKGCEKLKKLLRTTKNPTPPEAASHDSDRLARCRRSGYDGREFNSPRENAPHDQKISLSPSPACCCSCSSRLARLCLGGRRTGKRAAGRQSAEPDVALHRQLLCQAPADSGRQCAVSSVGSEGRHDRRRYVPPADSHAHPSVDPKPAAERPDRRHRLFERLSLGASRSTPTSPSFCPIPTLISIWRNCGGWPSRKATNRRASRTKKDRPARSNGLRCSARSGRSTG